ncbi:hypothetical protein [Halobacteriovorax sp. HLS]|uniref:hypothetical protein n=1 Tax=Halobacteriovorax sp. HLS TaxID=2234000 RepID=UPI000FD7AF74|nr:hypothetical protein [Halobacteriovorax sp. HLS]
MTTNSISQFSLTIIPGLEEIAIDEFNTLWRLVNTSQAPAIERKKGKLYLEADISLFCKIIPFLRVPTQALMLIDTFVCKDTPKLFNKISKIDWSKIVRGQTPLFTASAKESKLINTAMIKEKAQKAFLASAKHSPIKGAPKEKSELKNKVHIDIYQDTVKIEFNLGGERLDRRGLKKNTDQAPLRESIAAAMVWKLREFEKQRLLDPMCGTGSFSLEAATIFMYNKHRDYDYQYAPFYTGLPLQKRVQIQESTFEEIIYCDKEAKAVKASKENLKKLNSTKLKCIDVQDFFKLEDCEEEYSIILNPPYGKRIKLDEGLQDLLTKIITKSKSLKKARHLAMVFPKWAISSLKNEIIEFKTEFSNGGIEVVFIIVKLN